MNTQLSHDPQAVNTQLAHDPQAVNTQLEHLIVFLRSTSDYFPAPPSVAGDHNHAISIL